MLISIPKDVQFIIDTFYNNGYEAFMVGGCIRDALLKKAPMDYDIATSAPPEVTEKLFDKTIPTGIKHGTITVLINKMPYEVTTYRVEGKYSDNRKPDSVTFVSDIKEDLSRRDFTINAFAYNDRKGLIDYFSGNTDLKNRIIKCVGNADKRFKEDALRMLRAIRFSSQLNFDIDEKTYLAIKSNSKLIENVSNERMRVELSKILLSSNPFLGMKKLSDSSLLSKIIPYNLNINNTLDKLNNSLVSRLAFLFLNLDLSLVKDLLRKMTFDNNTINKVITLTSSYKLIDSINSKVDCKRLIISCGKENVFDLIDLYEKTNNKDLSKVNLILNEIINSNEPLYIKDLAIDGNYLITNLKIKPGRIIGEILNYLLNQVIEDKIKNNNEDLILCAKNYYSERFMDN
ncbi:tRNA nucleotidyltransferase (CCA-adding enzyme) [Clostridium sp. DSM 8431]|uniref:CCA tRNA nucleotidyltransferase n=1 Tax=Clostridium sp. DSM 8431 TaxID=1761781 RepID=UPI0008F05EB2|nr:CCA tRNA nucleotidyltransferase [Clostridium sp. DSM 8431]SFU38895.1 tRNA nucleotidyltransferase (CCA-adding enzyme) [Clostridium sp. DSM 8431]